MAEKMNKKGVSPVIATVLIVLITISAAAMISQVIIPFVKNNLYDSTACVPYTAYLKFQQSMGYGCMSGNDALITVKAEGDRESGKDIAGVVLVFSSDSNSRGVRIPSAEVSMLNPQDALRVPLSGESLTYKIADVQEFEYIDVKAELKSGKVCESSDRMKLLPC